MAGIMKIVIMAQLCSLMLAADCDGESCKEGSKAAGDETSLLQTSSQQTLKRSAGNKMTVMVFTFNAGEAELDKADFDPSHTALKASMKKRLDALSSKPDIVMFSSQEFVAPGVLSSQQDYHPLKNNMDLLEGYNHIGNTFISGSTKPPFGYTVRTSIEVAVKVGIEVPAEDNIKKSYQHFYFLKKSTKGMARLRATIGGMLFRFVGIHLDTKDALDNLKKCGEWVNAKQIKHGTGLSIFAGDYNTRLKSTAAVTCGKMAGVKAAFKVPSDGSSEAFIQKSDIYNGLVALSTNSGLKVHMPFPPLGNIGDDKYFMPTYKLEGCEACTPENVFDEHVICDAKKEKKSKEVSVGLLDYFTVLYDATKYKVESDNLNWDPQPKSDHAMVSGLMTVTDISKAD